MQHRISLIVITKNEETNIERCLNSVPWADEKIVVDSLSTDRTCELAQKVGARVVQEAWRGYGPQKRLATDLCRNDWILSLDADEALSPALAEEIQNLQLNPDVFDGYQVPRKS